MTLIREGFQSADLDIPVVLPTLNLDFANSQSLDERITFTRGSIGTFVNKNGLIETASANTPRFDYDPISGECRGLLIEEQRTNLLTYSNDFSNPVWVIGTLLYSFNTEISPDGTQNASTFTANARTASLNHIYQSFTCSASTTYTFSFYVRLGTLPASSYKIAVYNNTASSFIAADVVPTQKLSTTSWTRVSYTFTTPVGCVSARVYPYRNNSLTQNNGTFYLWGAQLESAVAPSQAPFATSYIPTSGSTVTRSPDLARLQDPYFSQLFNKYEGSVFVTYNMNSPVDNGSVYGSQRSQHLFYIGDRNDGTYQGYGVIQTWSTDYSHRLTGQSASQRTFGGSGAVYTSGSPITNGRVCFSYDADKLRLINDKLRSVSSVNRRGTNNYTQSITTQVFNEITIGWGAVGGAGNRYMTGTIKKLQFYPKSLNDAQMLYLVS